MPVSSMVEIRDERWILTARQATWFIAHAPKYPVCTAKESAGIWQGHTAFIIAPGPSVDQFPKELLNGKLTIAMNSAFFWTTTRYVCIAETTWVNWLKRDHELVKSLTARLQEQDLLLGGRTGTWWQMMRLPFRRIYFMRHQEEGKIPEKVTVGATIWNSLAQCKHMGCNRVVLIGADLARDQQPYAAGLAHNPEAELDDLSKQRASLMEAKFPGMEILNCNPRSNAFGLPWRSISLVDAISIAQDMPGVQ